MRSAPGPPLLLQLRGLLPQTRLNGLPLLPGLLTLLRGLLALPRRLEPLLPLLRGHLVNCADSDRRWGGPLVLLDDVADVGAFDSLHVGADLAAQYLRSRVGGGILEVRRRGCGEPVEFAVAFAIAGALRLRGDTGGAAIAPEVATAPA